MSALGLTACAHCQEPVPPARVPAEGPAFCCQGCETVAAVLERNGLTAYYRLADGALQPATTTGRAYAELDSEAFQAQAVTTLPDGARAADLYLEGVHCRACVWLIEKLPSLLPGVREARLDLGRSLARVTWDPQRTALSAIARTLDGLGYAPHPYRGGDRLERRRAEDRAFLIRIAIAFALAANVMLVSFALYAGEAAHMERKFTELFRWLALGLTAGAVLGPGRTFLAGAWAAVRTRTPHIDLPVGLALTVGLAGGAWNTVSGAGEVYFDTVSVLVCLLLIGRYLQHRRKRAAVDAAELLGSLAPSSARLLRPDGAVEEVPLEALMPGQRVEVRAGDAIPVDGVVVSGRSRVDTSLLTGEAWPRPVDVGDPVHAGTVNATARLVVDVREAGAETRVAKLMQQVEEHQRRKAPVVLLADRIAGGFVSVVLLLAALTLVVWLALDPSRAVDHAIALLIVTCPCALALATPLTISAALGRAARHGVLVRGGDALQRLATPGGRLWLDKTGTLTEGRTELLTWTGDEALRPLVLALEAGSAHPIARGFQEAWPDVRPAVLDTPPERVQAGLRGVAGGRELFVGAPDQVGLLPPWAQAAVEAALAEAHTPVVVAVDGEVAGVAALGDRLRPEAQAVLDGLRARGWRPGILSGDHPRVVAAVGRRLGLPPEDCRGGQTPEDKLAVVEAELEAGPVVMVGDGVNDAAALAAATVGVGVHGGSATVLEAADAFLSRGGLATLGGLLETARRSLKTIRWNFAFSLGYNLLAAGLAIAGVITPLMAAVLMPISSLTVIALSFHGPTQVAWPQEGAPTWT